MIPRVFLSTLYTSESGYTLVEVTIAVLLTSLLVGMAYASYSFSSRMLARWRQTINLENEMHVLMRDLTRRGHRAADVQSEGDRVTFISIDGRKITYRRHNRQLFRNEAPVLDRGVSLLDWRIRIQRETSSNRFESETAQEKRPMAHIHLVLASQQDTLRSSTQVLLRNAISWYETSRSR